MKHDLLWLDKLFAHSILFLPQYIASSAPLTYLNNFEISFSNQCRMSHFVIYLKKKVGYCLDL